MCKILNLKVQYVGFSGLYLHNMDYGMEYSLHNYVYSHGKVRIDMFLLFCLCLLPL